MQGPTRAFNGLNGAEIRTRILQELERKLGEDGRLGAHLVFPIVTWSWTLQLESAPGNQALGPGGDGSLRVEVRGSAQHEGAPATGPASSDSAVIDAPRRESALLDPHGRPVPVTAAEQEAGRVNARFRGDDPAPHAPQGPAPLAPAMEARLGRLESLMQQLAERVLTPQMGSPPPASDAIPLGSPPSLGVSFHPDIQMATATGLPITGGARPSPGPGLAESFGGGSAVGVVQTPEAVERVAFGVQHPPLDQGGVGAPDAVRREAGLPIPQMQATPGGGVVDLPAGSF